jgi:DNA polymerase V
MIRHPEDTYAVNVSLDSMIGVGIEPDDILIVDRGMEVKHNCIVIACLNGKQMVKRLLLEGESVSLTSRNKYFSVTNINGDMSFNTLGVVVWIIRKTA